MELLYSTGVFQNKLTIKTFISRFSIFITKDEENLKSCVI